MLEQIRGPADLQHLSAHQLRELAAEIREFLIHKVAATGGHLGPNLGVVELTLALHRVFDSPHDPIIFDTGHQAYVHKMLTGRSHEFETLRKKGGLSGYPSRAESEHVLQAALDAVQDVVRGCADDRCPGDVAFDDLEHLFVARVGA
jgi:1-deoxy-D-xylulose-5-phosphate synthase